MQVHKIERPGKLRHSVGGLILSGVEALEMHARITDAPVVEFEHFPVNGAVGFVDNATGIA